MPTIHYTVTVLFRSLTGGQFSMSFHSTSPSSAQAAAENFIHSTPHVRPILICNHTIL